MLPPIDPSTLDRNPRFKALYESLAAEKLNQDASTRDPDLEKTDAARREAIAARRTARAKTQILLAALEAARKHAVELPDELHEVLGVVSALANERVKDPVERELLGEDVAYFVQHIRPIAAALSAQLLALGTLLLQVALPDTSPSDEYIATLPTHAQTQQSAIRSTTHALATQRTHLAALSAAALSAQAHAAEAAIRVLEQTAHGSVARGLRAKAECLATVARGVELKIG
ncbi:uncharacterized protein K452DRAFT_287960 [Aplosporella prunicola CBS 121167]|uniref:Uncharacterized protein n=1 Tax=Aplosporella prunicola CBS 121167 TaxID=1176127 RepID=A0A6A6BDE5_9PEZI|nr:uncharacterized protein K452DRAFT_287960 [Aplosporella prunicola CBS 121167]KAF2141254.1 hypothetical protein K452DRAFT_287960 [Aplosporella prunicola CBS 121167]